MTARRRKTLKPAFHVSPETQRGILGVVFFALSALTLLSLLHAAGSAGLFIDSGLNSVFGQARVVIVILLAIAGAIQIVPTHPAIKASGIIGLFLFLFSAEGLLQTLHSLAPELTITGGYLGLLIGTPLLQGFGQWASLIIFFALILVSILLIGNTSIQELASLGKFIGRILAFCLRPLSTLRNVFQKNTGPRIMNGDEPFEEVKIEDEETNNEAGTTFTTRDLPEKKLTVTKQETAPPTSEFTEGMKRRSVRRVDLPLDLLSNKGSKPTSVDIKKNMGIIEHTLANFGIPVQMGDVAVGPTVTQFTLKPDDGVKLTKITALTNDLALALAAHPIRIEAPIPGKSLVGIEVPNQTVATVGLREILDTATFRERRNSFQLALGKDVAGHPWFADLPKLPHLLVAGATGSGKTVCLNAMIVSLLYQNSPDDLKLILIDPKRVELPVYNGIPHLLVPTITDVPKTINALRWTIGEMERRFIVLEKVGARDIGSYNNQSTEKMPALVVIVDELADLMAAAGREMEGGIIRIAQMARAVGIHLILATQRPSVDVITGLIKANIPARIAFSVASQTDSRTILDTSGAEKLLGRGDMLFTSPEISKPRRIQGAFVSDEETKRVVNYLKDQYDAPAYNHEVTEKQHGAPSFSGENFSSDSDPLLGEAKEVILQAGKASASLLQRRLKVGYARAARLLDLLEAEGFIGPGDGAKPRDILAGEGTTPTIFKDSMKEAGENDVPPWE